MPLRWQAVVFHVPLHEPPRIRAVEAARCPRLCLAAGMGTTSRIFIAIPDGDGPRSPGKSEDQFAPLLNGWFRPRRMGSATETEMDEVADLQPCHRKI